MSYERIRKAKAQQINIQANIEEKMVLVYKQRYAQTVALHKTEINKTRVAGQVYQQSVFNVQEATINTSLSQVKVGKATDSLGFEQADRALKQTEYRTRLELGQIKIGELIAQRCHELHISGAGMRAIAPNPTEWWVLRAYWLWVSPYKKHVSFCLLGAGIVNLLGFVL